MYAVSRRSPTRPRGGFTLVELLVVISIFVVLTVMTIGAINLSSTSERIRGAARQVQSKIEGARDRAIYASRKTPDNPRPVGVRLLVDENEPSICTSLVYVQSPGDETSLLDTTDIDNDGDRSEFAVFCQLIATSSGTAVIGAGLPPDADGPGGAPPTDPTPPSWATLYDRGLIGPGTRIRFPGSTDKSQFTLHPSSFPIRTESAYSGLLGSADPNSNNVQDPVLFLVRPHPDATSLNPLEFSMELNPDVMPDEDALVLPRGTCIDLETSHLPDGWVTQGASGPQFSNRMDILFTAKGPATGDAAAAGIIHLHIVAVADALENAAPGSPTLPRDTNGDGTDEYPVAQFPVPPERHGDELGITIFTKSGRTISHPVAFSDLHNPTAATDDGIYYPPVGTLPMGLFGPFVGNGRDRWNSSNTPYAVNDVVAPSIYNGLIFRVIRTNGTTLSGEPDWNLAPGGLTQGNQVVWQSIKHDVWGLALEGEVAK